MRQYEAQAVARRLYGENGRTVLALGGQYYLGVVREDGTWAGFYTAKSWAAVANRAQRDIPYDGPK